MLPNNIYRVYLKVPDGQGGTKNHPAGRFMTLEGKLHHLEDYHGVMGDLPQGDIDDFTMMNVANPRGRVAIASEDDIQDGHRRDLIPEAEMVKPMPQPVDVTPEMIQQHLTKKPPPVWNYRRTGHDIAHTLEHHGADHYTLDGNKLSRDELQTIAINLKNKSASIRYKGDGVADTIAKMETVFTSLRKEENDDPEAALSHVAGAVKAGHIPEAALHALRRHIYTDPMTGGVMGNKFAYNQFRQKQKPGVHIAMDGNDFKAINDLYGHEAGDQAIKSFGQAAREAMDETVGSQKGKLFRNPDEQDIFRNGGDEFAAHVPSHEHAARFARSLRGKLEAMPPIAGQHRLSMSFGFGQSPEHADQALYAAKEQKYQPAAPGQPKVRKFPHGQVPSLAHSLIPGHEGAIPLSEATLPHIEMPEGAKVEAPKPEEGQLLHTPKLPEPVATTKP